MFIAQFLSANNVISVYIYMRYEILGVSQPLYKIIIVIIDITMNP